MKKLPRLLTGLLLIFVGLLMQWLATLRGNQPAAAAGERLELLGNVLAEPDIMP